jgi:hypothetical protein
MEDGAGDYEHGEGELHRLHNPGSRGGATSAGEGTLSGAFAELEMRLNMGPALQRQITNQRQVRAASCVAGCG